MTRREGERALFDVLEPPAGGVRALKRRLVVERKKRVRRRRVAAATTSAAVVALALVLAFGRPTGTTRRAAPELDFTLARMRLGTLAVPEDAVTVAVQARADTAALALPTADSRVVMYLVASHPRVDTPTDDSPPSSGATRDAS